MRIVCLLAANVAFAGAFSPLSAPLARTPSNSCVLLRATADSAIADLASAQAASVDKIAAAIGPDLECKPELSWATGTVAGSAATIDGREAPGANGNVAWLANACVASKTSSLTIFNGPLTDVPHLLSRASVSSGGSHLRFTLDFRPRAYGAYELVNADGTYPGPETFGRDSFTYSGNRKEFDTKFGTDEVASFVQSLPSQLEDAVVLGGEANELDLLTRGPLFLDVACPLTDGNVAAIAAARTQAADYWLGWAMDQSHAHRPGAPVNSQYVYDTKYRQNAYGGLLAQYSADFGPEDGAAFAAAESGPLDEAYVGGGS